MFWTKEHTICFFDNQVKFIQLEPVEKFAKFTIYKGKKII